MDYPDLVLDVSLVLASIGYELASANPPDDKFNEKTIRFAKLAIQQINDGKLSSNGDWGAFQYTYRTKKCPDGKLNATGWMNYIIDYIMFSRQNQQNESLPYLYQAAQIGCETTKNYEIYRMIGDLYLEESFKSSEKKKDYLAKALNYYQKAFETASANPKVPKNHKDQLREKIKNLLKLNKQEK